MFYKLCLLDHYQNHRYLSLFFYYALNLSGAAVNIDLILSNRLQLPNQSQSETLVQYYPLVGNLTEIYSIDLDGNEQSGQIAGAHAAKVQLVHTTNIIYHVNTLCTDDEVEFDDLVRQAENSNNKIEWKFCEGSSRCRRVP
ncbi:hypothetical protein WN944_023240 [Citrus x changshan-huyou]|uniref:Uncharacterized protein n=1 Tax=Citrus x changshan-huyou TaxID=2935761 RepID=A0AAP0N220_9ROSI